jgi:hypothetical protein
VNVDFDHVPIGMTPEPNAGVLTIVMMILKRRRRSTRILL